MCLACLSTLAVALSLGAFGAARVFYAFQAPEGLSITASPPTLNESGDIVILDTLPAEALTELQRRQESINWRETAEATFILLVAAGAWAVVLMYAFEWRWLVFGVDFRTR
jgi:hypothetical protein